MSRRRMGVSQADEGGREFLAEGTAVKVWRCEQSPAVFEDLLSRLAGMSSCFPCNATHPHCTCGLDVPTFLPSILHSFNQPFLIGPSACQALFRTLGTKARGSHSACRPGALS